MNMTGQKPKQLSEAVMDSRPALMLKEWSEEESERARELEMRAFGVPVPPPAQRERFVLEMLAAKVPLDTQVDSPDRQSEQAKLLREAIYGYDLVGAGSRRTRRPNTRGT